MDGTKSVALLLAEVKDKTDQWFPESEGYKVEWAGTAFTLNRMSDMIIARQITSLLISVLAIFLLCWWMFGRVQIALIAMVPVSLAVTVSNHCYLFPVLLGLGKKKLVP